MPNQLEHLGRRLGIVYLQAKFSCFCPIFSPKKIELMKGSWPGNDKLQTDTSHVFTETWLQHNMPDQAALARTPGAKTKSQLMSGAFKDVFSAFNHRHHLCCLHSAALIQRMNIIISTMFVWKFAIYGSILADDPLSHCPRLLVSAALFHFQVWHQQSAAVCPFVWKYLLSYFKAYSQTFSHYIALNRNMAAAW